MTATSSDNTITFTATANGACDNSYLCCDVPLDKIEFVISDNCRGAITTVSYGKLPSYQYQNWTQFPPKFDAPVLVAKVPGLFSNAGVQYLSTTITLDPKNLACNTAEKFLFKSVFWWAAFGSTPTKSNGCCGTLGY